MSLRRSVTPALVLALALLGLPPAALSQPITVDGDLSDWDAITPHGEAIDPCNELFPLCKSGFDFTRVLVFYDPGTDTLFFGIDPMDVEGAACQGLPGPGVPGDADGNLDPCTDGDLPECEVNEDQECVGVDEQYLLKVDTNFDGDFVDEEDLRVVYRGNMLRFERGNGAPFPWTGDIRLGMAGANKACACVNENPLTEDIEIAVFNYSDLDPVPVCFIVDAIAGSLVDLPPEDFLDEPILVSISEPDVTINKRVRNVTQGTPFNELGTGANVGETVEFEIVACNTGNVGLDPATITDEIKAGFENPILVSGPGCNISGNQLECTPGLIGPGECVTILYQVDVAAGATGVLRNMAIVSGTALQEGENPVCGGELVTDQDDTRVVVLELSCEKLVSLDGVNFSPTVPAVPGQTVTFKVVATNDGVSDLTDVAFEDTLPAGFENVVSLDPRVTVDGNTLSSDQVGPLDKNGGSTEILYEADVAMDAVGPLVNNAMFTGTAEDDTQTTTECSAQVDVVEPDIECTKLVSLDGVSYSTSAEAAPGQTVFFRVLVDSTGTADLFTASLTDVLPPVYTDIVVTQGACDVTGQTVQCDEIGPIPAGDQVVIEYRATFTADSGIHTNTAEVSGTAGTPSNPGDTVTSECSADVTGLTPAIVCTKGVSTTQSDFGPSVEAFKGQTVFFEVQVQNAGTAPFFDAGIVDILPAGFEDVQVVSGACSVNGNTIDCSTGPLGPGDTATILYSARLAVEDTTLVNLATVTGFPGLPGNPGTTVQSACSATVISPLVDVSCEKGISTDGINFFPSLEVLTGETVFFRVTVTNSGEARLKLVALDDVLPDGYANVQILSGACTVNGQAVRCDQLGPLDPDETAVVEYQADVIAMNPPTETLVNTAMVLGQPGTVLNPGDPETTECSAVANLISPSVTCDKEVSVDGIDFFTQVDAAPGQIVLFRVTVTNDSSGPVTLDPVTIADVLPAGLDNLKVVSGNCSAVGNTLNCDVGPLAEGESAQVLYRAKVVATSGVIQNTAMITATHDGGDVTTECSALVNVVPAEIECLKEVSRDGVTFKDRIGIAPGQLAWFRVTISNPGPSDLFTHSLTDVLPAGFADAEILSGPGCVAVGEDTVQCDDLGPLAAGGPPTVVLYRARLAGGSGSLVNTAQVSGRPGSQENPGDPVGSDCSATVDVQVPEIVCEKGVSLQPDSGFVPSVTVARGMTVYFRILATNTGETHFLTADLDDVVPAGLGNITILEGNCTASGNTVDCELGPLPKNAPPVTVRFAAQVLADGPLTVVNTADVTAVPGTSDQNPGDPVGTSCEATVVIGVPSILCEKSASPEEPVPGQTVTFTVLTRNDGDVGLVNVTLDDALDPAAFDNVQIVQGSCAVAGNDIACDLGELASGEETTVIFTARLIATGGTADNVALVAGEPGVPGNTGEPVGSSCPVTLEIQEPDIECDKNVSLDGVTFADSVVAQPGDMVWFEVIASNVGEACFRSVSLEDVLPDGFENLEILEGAGCIVLGSDTVQCADLGTLCPVDDPIRVVYRAAVRVSPPPTGTLVNTALVTGNTGTDANPGDPVTSQCSATVSPVQIEIQCVKTADPSVAVTGQTVEFEVTVTNTSPDDVPFDSVSFLDTLPEGLTDIQLIEPGAGCEVDEIARTITCDDLGPLAQGESLTVRYSARVTATNPPVVSLVNDVFVTGTAGELVAMSQCAATVVLGAPEVVCTKGASTAEGGPFVDPASAVPGQRVFFEVVVTNTGDVPFFTGTLADTLPAGFEEIQVETPGCNVIGSTVSCPDLGSIDPAESVSVRYSARVAANPPADPLVNTADVTVTPGTAQNPGDPLATSCSASVDVLEVDLVCVKEVSTDGASFGPAVQAVPGQDVFFRVTLTNSGEGSFFQVTLTDLIDPAFFENPVTLDPGICSLNGNTLECTFGPLDSGDSEVIDFQATVRSGASGTVQNTASVEGTSGTTPNPGIAVQTQCTADIEVLVPGIECVKEISKDGVNFFPQIDVLPGDHVFFRVTASNTGDVDLLNVMVEDPVPGAYVNVSTADPNCAVVAGELSCDLGTLAPAAQAIVLYEADVSPAAAGPIINTATVSADTGDPANPGNPVQSSCSATAEAGPLEIPTLTEIGFLVMALLLGATLILHQRCR